MSKPIKPNRVFRWIERRNHAACLRIARTYYRRKEQGRPIPIWRLSLFFAVLQRFLWVFLLLFRSGRNSFENYKNRSFGDFCKRLVGINRFEIRNLLPLRSDFPPFSYPQQADVQVSIVICVHNHIDYTYNCLLSILQDTSEVNYEVIVVNDCSTDETSKVLTTIGNVTVIENEENLGFLKSCNRALSAVSGQYVCFLNNDVQVQSGWLANLIAPFNQFDDVGLVGAKLIYPYGLLQEAGGIVNYQGEPANYGKFSDPDDVYYNYLRQTDYCSGACIVLSKKDLDMLGGFDEQFAPAYYEDTDLAFRVRYQLGKKVYYQPLARVIHFEGVSSGKVADGQNVKSYQTANARRFQDRWASVFTTFPETLDATMIARKFIDGNRNVLIVERSLPAYDQDSGSRRMFELIKLMRQLGWGVLFSAEKDTKQEPYYSVLVNMGVWVLNKPIYEKSSKNVIKRVIPWVDVAWVCRPGMNRRYGVYIKRFGVRWINDTVDIHFLREERALKFGYDNVKKKKKVDRSKKRELRLMRAADAVLVVTPIEAELLTNYAIRHATVIPNVHDPVNNVLPGFTGREGICFIGSYAHLPNVDAVNWLINEIMPLVWQKLPAVHVYLLGSMPTKQVMDLASEKVHVPGYLADVSPYFLSSRVFVAPLRFGAGMKGKIGQSLAFGLPTITTDIGAEGMGLKDRVHYLRANTAEQFAEAILTLYTEETLWQELSNGAQSALAPYAPERVKRSLIELLEQ